jgi:hypothetical protein
MKIAITENSRNRVYIPVAENSAYSTLLVETFSLGRVYHHLTSGFLLVSAFRGERTLELNEKCHAELKRYLKRIKMGFIEVYGGFIENKDQPNELTVEELSLLVPYKKIEGETFQYFEHLAGTLRTLFKPYQDSVLLIYPDKTMAFVDATGIHKDGETQFHPDKLGQYFTKLVKGNHAGRKFVLDTISVNGTLNEALGLVVPSNSISAMAMVREGNIIV